MQSTHITATCSLLTCWQKYIPMMWYKSSRRIKQLFIVILSTTSSLASYILHRCTQVTLSHSDNPETKLCTLKQPKYRWYNAIPEIGTTITILPRYQNCIWNVSPPLAIWCRVVKSRVFSHPFSALILLSENTDVQSTTNLQKFALLWLIPSLQWAVVANSSDSNRISSSHDTSWGTAIHREPDDTVIVTFCITILIELSHNTSTDWLTHRYMALVEKQPDLPKLTWRQQIGCPVLQVFHLHIKPWTDDRTLRHRTQYTTSHSTHNSA